MCWFKQDDKCIGFREFHSTNQESEKIFPYESICIPFILLKFQDELELSNNQKKTINSSNIMGVRIPDWRWFLSIFLFTVR